MAWQWTYPWWFVFPTLVSDIVHRTVRWQQITVWYLSWRLPAVKIAHHICCWLLIFHVFFNTSLPSFFGTHWWTFATSSLARFGASIIWRDFGWEMLRKGIGVKYSNRRHHDLLVSFVTILACLTWSIISIDFWRIRYITKQFSLLKSWVIFYFHNKVLSAVAGIMNPISWQRRVSVRRD